MYISLLGALELKTESFDLVFTSPPFFDYEMYNPSNPQYKNWINEFYHPLFLQSCRCVKVQYIDICIFVYVIKFFFKGMLVFVFVCTNV
jgi:hypothetical protein